MGLGRLFLMVLLLLVGLLVYAVTTDTYTVKIPTFFTERFYSDDKMWKYYEGFCQSDFVTFNEDFVSRLPENTRLVIRWRPTGDYFLYLNGADYSECVYISLF